MGNYKNVNEWTLARNKISTWEVWCPLQAGTHLTLHWTALSRDVQVPVFFFFPLHRTWAWTDQLWGHAKHYCPSIRFGFSQSLLLKNSVEVILCGVSMVGMTMSLASLQDVSSSWFRNWLFFSGLCIKKVVSGEHTVSKIFLIFRFFFKLRKLWSKQFFSWFSRI